MHPNTKQLAAFFSKIVVVNGCWIWQAARTNGGYGKCAVARVTSRAHRVAYKWFVGPIPDGFDLDHLCRTRLCVNPAHVEPVTKGENNRRGKEARGFTCRRGHSLISLENTLVIRRLIGGRWYDTNHCRECGRLRRIRKTIREGKQLRPSRWKFKDFQALAALDSANEVTTQIRRRA